MAVVCRKWGAPHLRHWNAMKGFHTLMRLAHMLNTLALHQVALWPTVQAKGIGPTIHWIYQTIAGNWLDTAWELAGYGSHRRASESAPLPTAGLVERRRLLSQLHRCVGNRGSSTAWLCHPLPWVTPFRHPRAGGSSRWHHGKTVKDLPANRHNRPRCITTYLVGASELELHPLCRQLSVSINHQG